MTFSRTVVLYTHLVLILNISIFLKYLQICNACVKERGGKRERGNNHLAKTSRLLVRWGQQTHTPLTSSSLTITSRRHGFIVFIYFFSSSHNKMKENAYHRQEFLHTTSQPFSENKTFLLRLAEWLRWDLGCPQRRHGRTGPACRTRPDSAFAVPASRTLALAGRTRPPGVAGTPPTQASGSRRVRLGPQPFHAASSHRIRGQHIKMYWKQKDQAR